MAGPSTESSPKTAPGSATLAISVSSFTIATLPFGCHPIVAPWNEIHTSSFDGNYCAAGNPGLSKFEDHQGRAAECLRLAHEASDLTNKALLLEMAQTWIRLAEQVKARASDDTG
jgi:hypothetical protein